MDTPSRTSRLTSVASTSSPSCTRSSGPGTRPLNVSRAGRPAQRRDGNAALVELVDKGRPAAVVRGAELERAERPWNATCVPGDGQPDDDGDDPCEARAERKPF